MRTQHVFENEIPVYEGREPVETIYEGAFEIIQDEDTGEIEYVDYREFNSFTC